MNFHNNQDHTETKIRDSDREEDSAEKETWDKTRWQETVRASVKVLRKNWFDVE